MLDLIKAYATPLELVAFVFVLAASYVAGYHNRGVIAERDEALLQKTMQQAIIQQQEKVATVERTLAQIVNTTEKAAYANNAKHDKELVTYKRIIDQYGGLFDNFTTGPSNNETAPSTSGDTGGTSGARLSEAASGFLLEEANKADRVVDQYRTCQQYIQSLTSALIQGAIK